MKETMRQSSEQTAIERHERALIAQIANDDRDALGELYQLYHPRLFKFIFGLIRTYDAADELVNDVMLIVWRGAGKFRGAARVSTWIFGIAYRQTMRRVTRKGLRLVSQSDPDELPAPMADDVEREDWVRTGIAALPTNQQAAVILVFYHGLSYAEAAAIADCPVNTIKTRMFHARKKLREFLDHAAQPVNANIGNDDESAC